MTVHDIPTPKIYEELTPADQEPYDHQATDHVARHCAHRADLVAALASGSLSPEDEAKAWELLQADVIHGY